MKTAKEYLKEIIFCTIFFNHIQKRDLFIFLLTPRFNEIKRLGAALCHPSIAKHLLIESLQSEKTLQKPLQITISALHSCFYSCFIYTGLIWFSYQPLVVYYFFSFSPFWTLFDLNRLRAGSERIANVRVNYWILCCSVLLCRDGVHLHRRIRQNQGQSALCGSSTSFCWW